MKVAILYICTGKYECFFRDFYLSCEKYFLKEASKQYFVWTDSLNLADTYNNVQIIYRKGRGFPEDSLFRFDMFLQIEKELNSFDYIYFFNANTLFVNYVGNEILPNDTGLAMGVWRGFREKLPPLFYPYERNPKSLAYVAPYGKDYTYYMGGINGGRADEYLKLIHVLSDNIRKDYENGIIAIVHDESHINAYLRTTSCKKLAPELTMPEEWVTPEDKPKIILRDKTSLDPYFNKNRRKGFLSKTIKAVKIIISAARWYLKI